MHLYLHAIALLVSLFVQAQSVVAQDKVIKSPNDDALYETFELPNGLRVVVVSDPNTDKAAAALSVRVGAGSDPKGRAGLAHFLEHMLFLGTEKYPSPGEYQSFIRSNGGSQNAFTSYEFTTYYFDIEPSSLEPALDRFSQFFKNPLFDPRYVEREVNAVDSEYRARLKDDGRRRSYATKAVMNPNHSYSGFTTGNLETLNHEGLREELLAFYDQHYSANLMTLAVMGGEPIDVLKQWAQEKFNSVKDKGRKPLTEEAPLFEDGRLPLQLNITPNKDRRSLSLAFPVTPTRSEYRSKPNYLVGAVLGYEGPGSLLSTLRTRGWADAISAGGGIDLTHTATFSIGIALTEQGLNKIDEIVHLVFQQIRNLRNAGIARWLYEEQKALSELAFRYQEQSEASNRVLSLVSSLHEYPPPDLLRGPYLFDEFNPNLTMRLVNELIPDKLLLSVVAKDLETEQLTTWYETPYATIPISADQIQRWNTPLDVPDMYLQAPNPYIPEDLSLLPGIRNHDNAPETISRSARQILWYKQETSYGSPRADFYTRIDSQVANDTAEHAVLSRMYVALVNDQINEATYPAHVSGLYFQLHPSSRGLTLRISGYNDKQALLLETIVAAMANPMFDPQRFAVLKERRLRSLKNAILDRPISQTNSRLTRLLLEPNWSEEQQIAALASLQLADLESFVPKLLKNLSVVSLAHGNLSDAQAKRLSETLEKLRKHGSGEAAPSPQIVRLEDNSAYAYRVHIDHDDSAYTHYFQAKDKDFKSRALTGLLAQVISPAYYQSLRTKQQLGYIVHASLATLLDTPGLSFVVQSPVADPSKLRALTEDFIADFLVSLEDMTDAEFESQKHGFITQLTESDKSLNDRTNRYWRELEREHFTFDTQALLVEALEAATISDLRRFSNQLLTGNTRRSIIVYSVGQEHIDGFDSESFVADLTAISELGQLRTLGKFFER